MVYFLYLFNNGDCLVSQGTREEDDVVSEDLVEQDAQVSSKKCVVDIDHWLNYTTNQYYIDSYW